MGPKIFGGLNEKSGFIFIKQEIYGKILLVAQVIRPNVRRTMEKTRLRYGHFSVFLEVLMGSNGQINSDLLQIWFASQSLYK